MLTDLGTVWRRLVPADTLTRRVFVQGAGMAPLALADSLKAAPELAQGVAFVGVWIPGMNRTDWAASSESSTAETSFASLDWRETFQAGRTRILPLGYRRAYDWLSATPLDLAVVQVAPPDADGLCSLSLAADFAPAILAREVPILGLINVAAPDLPGAPKVPLSRFAAVAEVDHPLTSYDSGALDPVSQAAARRATALIPDGATVQTGIGKLGAGVLAELRDHRNLKLFGGMALDGLVALEAAGALDPDAPRVAGGLYGGQRLIEHARRDPRLRLEPVSVTHDLAVLARQPCLCAVNSALEVDLFGQVNGERLDGRLVSGVGGLADFLRGARASEGGAGVVVLPSTAAKGTVSRIRPLLDPGSTTIARSEAELILVTEHGVADLRGLDLDARAEAILAIAAPQHQAELAAAWGEIKRGF
ncbi:MAG: acetyl-CoA hydrolase/transferase C-terminal domain-containing protein [Pseudomonadota bacterium]|jgi:acyl-CoA hydrolase